MSSTDILYVGHLTTLVGNTSTFYDCAVPLKMHGDDISSGRSGGTPDTGIDKRIDAPHKDQFFIVGIGASAGGLEPIETFFDNMPAEVGLSFVLVQHLSPDFKSLMDELLSRHTRMKIHRVTEGMLVEPNCIYLIPPKKNMVLSEGRLRLSDFAGNGILHLPIDTFFHSLADEAGDRAIAVVLSGTGSDGSRGIIDVHEAGGLVLVQSIESSLFDGMPRNAVSTGIADIVCEPERMAETILQYVQQPGAFPRGQPENRDIPVDESDLATIFRLFRHRYGVDFSQYKLNTIGRRIDRRMKLVRSESLQEYVSLLQENLTELEELYRDLLVEVTSFFRDPAAFELIRQNIVPKILEQAQPGEHIRVWVPACATGEEAYSLAMLFHEAAMWKTPRPEVKIFATDVYRHSLESASIGIYSPESLNRVPSDLRARYFVRHGELFQVAQEIRKIVVFAAHDITKDPPFTKIDLLSCRNVLIYFDPEVQRRVIANFHFALKVQSFLFLGPSETTGIYEREFQPVNQHWKVFQKIRDVRLANITGTPSNIALQGIIPASSAQVVKLPSRPDDIVESVMDDLLDRFVPPSFLVDSHFDLIHSFGNAREILIQPKGRPTLEVLKMVDGDLRVALTSALHRARRDGAAVAYRDVVCEINGAHRTIDLIVEPFEKRQQKLYLVILRHEVVTPSIEESTEAEAFDSNDQSQIRLQDIERELNFTRESLQSTVEELETSNEELQSTNEELVAANEELQSTNEELHSVNEELYTVNAEHQRKIDELTQMTADMDNLLQSTEVGTVFLDRQFRIRKFTPAIAAAFHMMEQDVGRPITHIAYHLDDPELIEHIRLVIQSGETMEREVRSRDGRSFLKTVRPYRTATGEIDGAVVTFFEISAVKQAERQLELVLDNAPNLIAYLDRGLRLLLVNQQFANQFRSRKDQLLGKQLQEVLGPVTFAEMEPYFNSVLEGSRQVFEHREITLRSVTYWTVAMLPDIRKGEFMGVFLSMSDISELKRGQLFGATVEASPTAIVMIDERGDIILVNRETEQLFGYARDEMIGQSVDLLVPERMRIGHSKMRHGYLVNPVARRMGEGRELFGLRRNGTEFPIEIGLNPIHTEDGVFVLSAIVDITERKKLEERFEVSVESSPAAIVMIDEKGNIVMVNQRTESLFGHDREELIGKSIEILMPERLRRKDETTGNILLQDLGVDNPLALRKMYGVNREGREFPVDIGIRQVELSEGKFVLATILESENLNGSEDKTN